jgi:cell wall-associated NlpC family hydrolase
MKKLTLLLFGFLLTFAPIMAHAEYTVKKGDTLYKISKQYNMSLTDLKSLNPHIVNFNQIRPNDFIVVRKIGNTRQDLVDYAKSLQSVTTYVWGGTPSYAPPLRTDCSGWVEFIYGKFGIKLPRVSRDQAKVGKRINNIQDAKIGDLIFFASDKVHISHVGIAMGNGMWISNLRTGKNVVIEQSWGTWAKSHFMWATDVID